MVENKTFSALNSEQDVSIQAVLVGFDQAVEADDEKSISTLKRDVDRIRKFFTRRGVDTLSEDKSIEFVTAPETNYDSSDDNSSMLSDDSSNCSSEYSTGKGFSLSRFDSSSSIRTVANHNFGRPSKLQLRGISDSSSDPGDIGRFDTTEPKKTRSITNKVEISGTVIHWEARDIASRKKEKAKS